MCYNTITSERFFFFAENPNLIVFIYIVRCFLFCDYMLWNGTYITEPREAFTFTKVRVKAKNISVKREVPLNESKNHISLHRVQTAQLQHKEKQEEHSRQN